MSVLATTTRASVAPATKGAGLHRALLYFSSLLAIASTIAIAVYGFDYYPLDQAHRVLSPKHQFLKPSGILGIRLGIFGVCLFLLIYLYAIRKRLTWLAKRGNSKHWLDFHVLLGLAAPVVITFHSSFKFQGIAGVAYWIMMAVALSGFIGRYIYAQIPRRLDDAEMSLKEMQDWSAKLTQELTAQRILRAAEVARLLRFPSVGEVQSMSLIGVLAHLVSLDVSCQLRIWRLRRRALGSGGSFATLGGLLSSHRAEIEEVIVAVRRQAALSKQIGFLAKTRQLFHLWHVIHRPFSYSFAILACIHIVAAMMLGYF